LPLARRHVARFHVLVFVIAPSSDHLTVRDDGTCLALDKEQSRFGKDPVTILSLLGPIR
jgi:hypothetical protein